MDWANDKQFYIVENTIKCHWLQLWLNWFTSFFHRLIYYPVLRLGQVSGVPFILNSNLKLAAKDGFWRGQYWCSSGKHQISFVPYNSTGRTRINLYWKTYKSLCLIQISFRVVTFLLNALVLHNVDKAVLGILNVRLMLLVTTILFVSRESFRKACLSKTRDHNWPQVINLLWLTWVHNAQLITSCIYYNYLIFVTGFPM